MGTVEENLARNLKRLREAAGLTLKQLAKKAEMNEGTIYKWEHEKQGFRKNNLKAVAKALGCSTEDLISPYQAPALPELAAKAYSDASIDAASEAEIKLKILESLNALNKNQLLGILDATTKIGEMNSAVNDPSVAFLNKRTSK